jgi:hypothetical protein
MEKVNADDIFRFNSIFAGRNDAFFDGRIAQWKRPTTVLFAHHLRGCIDGIGTYPVRDDCTCRWGCIDLDGTEYTFDSAVNVWSVWQYYGIEAFIERSRSKGWHIWTFASEWTSAEIMRNAGLQVAKLAKLPSDTEVNPKGTNPKHTRTGLINTVRLPYPGRSDWQRQVVLDPASALVLTLREFLARATAARSPSLGFSRPAGVYLASVTEQARTERYSALLRKQPSLSASKSNQEAMEVLKGTKRITVNRDNMLFTLANLMHGISVPYEEALARMQEIWHTQLDQSPDFIPLHTAVRKVERVYH